MKPNLACVLRSYVSHGLKLHYWDYGVEGKPPLVMVHGGMDHARSWDVIARPFLTDFHVFALDLRGHGESDWAPGNGYTIPQFVSDLSAFCATLGDRPVAFLSHSLGGLVSLCFAAAFPERVRKAVIVEGLGGPTWYERTTGLGGKLRQWIEDSQRQATSPRRSFSTLEMAIARMKEANPHLSDEMARHLTEFGSQRNADGSYSWKFDPTVRSSQHLHFSRDEMEQILSAVQCPVLFVDGENGWAEKYARSGLPSLVHDQRQLRVVDAGHWIQHDNPGLLVSAAKEFLSA